MRSLNLRFFGSVLLLAMLLAGCNKLGLDKLGLGRQQHSTELPSAKELKTIHYMSQSAGPDGRQVFDHLEQAKSCHDLEIAMRWNRPPDMKGGPFNAKMVYLDSAVPASLPKNTEVFISGEIEQGESQPSGSSVWALKLKDGSELQAIESTEYVQKQAEAQQEGGQATMVHPYTHGRALCAYGIYQGNSGLSLDQKQHVPLVSVLFAMDRRR
ncbi:MAG TPA: hypothetical protein VFW10_05950 [Steroidobacteraceae bacterium]|nr:hypothetical protein [Steroidobacteraceae bacterium]